MVLAFWLRPIRIFFIIALYSLSYRVRQRNPCQRFRLVPSIMSILKIPQSINSTQTYSCTANCKAYHRVEAHIYTFQPSRRFWSSALGSLSASKHQNLSATPLLFAKAGPYHFSWGHRRSLDPDLNFCLSKPGTFLATFYFRNKFCKFWCGGQFWLIQRW